MNHLIIYVILGLIIGALLFTTIRAHRKVRTYRKVLDIVMDTSIRLATLRIRAAVQEHQEDIADSAAAAKDAIAATEEQEREFARQVDEALRLANEMDK